MGSSIPGNACRTSTRCCAPSTGAGCIMTLPGTCVYYSGTHITAPGINTGDNFNVVVTKLVDYIEDQSVVTTQMSITSDSNGLRLVGDEETPGNDQYYGTDGTGTKGFYDLPSSGGFATAMQGVSADINDPTIVVWGQDVGDLSNPAALTSSREIPFASNTMTFSQDVNNGIAFAPPTLTVFGEALNSTPATIQFNDNNGQGATISMIENRLTITQTFGQGITLFDTGQIEIAATPSSTPPSDTEVIVDIAANTRVNAWLLRRVRVNSSNDDYAATPEDSGTAFVKIFDGNVFNRVITLPDAEVGLIYHFGYEGNGTVFIQIAAQAGDTIYFGDPSVNPSVASSIECNSTGATITLCCLTPGFWHPLAQVGVWSIPI